MGISKFKKNRTYFYYKKLSIIKMYIKSSLYNFQFSIFLFAHFQINVIKKNVPHRNGYFLKSYCIIIIAFQSFYNFVFFKSINLIVLFWLETNKLFLSHKYKSWKHSLLNRILFIFVPEWKLHIRIYPSSH
jgi:hypothetical protein